MSDSSPPDSRLNAATLEAYFAAGTVVPIHLADTPRCTLRINPPAGQLELWTPAHGPEPDLAPLDRVTFLRTQVEDAAWFVLAVDARGAHFEAYSLIAAVVDDLVEGRPFYAATARSLATYRELLAVRSRLSEEKAIGLFGELLVLEHLVMTSGEINAVGAWLGPQAEEHDFVLKKLDAEVKTTLLERRIHVIGSETQLQSSPDRPLWLISIQLTRAGMAEDGATLADVVSRVQSTLTTTAETFETHLGKIGWRVGDAELYSELYILRSHPKAYLVGDRFPAITRRGLERTLVLPGLVRHVTYRVDVTDLEAGAPAGPLKTFVVSEEI